MQNIIELVKWCREVKGIFKKMKIGFFGIFERGILMDSSTRVAEVIKKIKRAEVIIITTSTFFFFGNFRVAPRTLFFSLFLLGMVELFIHSITYLSSLLDAHCTYACCAYKIFSFRVVMDVLMPTYLPCTIVTSIYILTHNWRFITFSTCIFLVQYYLRTSHIITFEIYHRDLHLFFFFCQVQRGWIQDSNSPQVVFDDK